VSRHVFRVIRPDDPGPDVAALKDHEGDVWTRDAEFPDRWWLTGEGISYRFEDLVDEYGPLEDVTEDGAS
jgi:hypothetical protein